MNPSSAASPAHPAEGTLLEIRRRRRLMSIQLGTMLAHLIGLHAIAGDIPYGPPVCLCERLQDDDIVESSGLAPSRRHPGLFWTHNDSGDGPRLFAFDAAGRHHGTSHLKGAHAVDWEDMGSFTLKGRHYLFVADVGDNSAARLSKLPRSREPYTIYLAEEPASPRRDTQARPLEFRYDDQRAHDCEAVALDTSQQVFILVEKIRIPGFPCGIYLLPWKSPSTGGERVARRIGQLDGDHRTLLGITAMDISPDGQRALLATYGLTGFEFQREPDESWEQAFAKPPRVIRLPGPGNGRRQGESICYGLDGVTLFLTSEKRPCPLFTIPPLATPTEP